MSIKSVDSLTLKAWLDQDKAVLIDVREDMEYADECIGAAFHMPLSAFNPDGLPDHEGRVVVFHCASGNRTNRFSEQLTMAVAKARDVYHLDGGIIAWKEAGFGVAAGTVADLPDPMPHIGAFAGQGAPCAPAG